MKYIHEKAPKQVESEDLKSLLIKNFKRMYREVGIDEVRNDIAGGRSCFYTATLEFLYGQCFRKVLEIDNEMTTLIKSCLSATSSITTEDKSVILNEFGTSLEQNAYEFKAGPHNLATFNLMEMLLITRKQKY